MKIFINCATGLGNIILFLPAYRLLIKKYPNAKYTIALDSRFYDNPFIKLQFGKECNFIKIYSKKEGYLKFLFSFIKLIKFHFDISLSAFNGNSIFNGICLFLVRSKKTLYFKTSSKLFNKIFNPTLNFPPKDKHYIEINYSIVNSLGIEGDIPKRWIILESDKEIKTLEFNKDILWIGVHPGGNIDFNSARQWPKEYYKKLIGYILQQYNAKIIIFGKDTMESKLLDFIISENKNNCIKIINRSLIEVSILLSKCDIFIGNDSSLMNMSVALNVPTLCIIGPTNPYKTGPYGKNHAIAKLNLNCMPCFDSGYSELCPHHKCLNKLYPEIVLNKFESLIINENII